MGDGVNGSTCNTVTHRNKRETAHKRTKDRPSAGAREHLLPLAAGASTRTLHVESRGSGAPASLQWLLAATLPFFCESPPDGNPQFRGMPT